MIRFYIVLAFFTLNSFVFGGGVTNMQKNMNAIKVNKTDIIFDGKLTEKAWEAEPVSGFIQSDPDEGAPSTEKTAVWIAYDEDNLYVAARMFDSKPDSIDKSLARKDSWFDSDWFFFYIDPHKDKKTGYYFKVNAGGSTGDGVLYNDSWDSDSWDGIWEAKTNVDKNGWTVEMRIPFSQFRFNAADSMVWGVNFSRRIKRTNEKSFLVMTPKKESGFVSRFVLLDGLNGIKPKQRIEFIPYLVQKAQFLKHDANDPFYKSSQYRTLPGADIKIGIGSNLNLDATINPDFGQVEVDPAVVNLSAFESYFDEKRPFFIEGSDIFSFGFGGSSSYSSFNFGIPELLYTRRIGRTPQGDVSSYDYIDIPGETKIIGAAKLTGKLDTVTSIGALSAVTERTFATLDYNGVRTKEVVEPLTHYGVLRARREFNNGAQALGFMLTGVNRDLSDSSSKAQFSNSAYDLGIDGWTFLDADQEYVVTGAFAGSYVKGSKEYLQTLQEKPYRYYQRPDATYITIDSSRTSLAGAYGRLMLNKQKGNFYINSAIGFVSPGFENNDIGYQFMADRINGHLLTGYSWYDPDKIFRSKSIFGAYARTTDFEGNTLSSFLWYSSSFQFLNYYGFNLGASYSFETLNKTLTRGGPLTISPASYSINLSAYSDSRDKLSVNPYCYYSNDATNSNDFSLGVSFVWRPNPQIYVSFEPHFEHQIYKRQWIDNFSDDLAAATYKTRYVFADLEQKTFDAGIRMNMTFTPALSFQVYLQPLISVGSYTNYKELAKPHTLNFALYKNTGANISYDKDANKYTIDPDGAGSASSFTFDRPDFNYKSLRGTAVLRWEARPGSVLFLVWTHEQTDDNDAGNLEFGRDFRHLIQSQGNNIFLIKYSYWFHV
jgi:hypothetical protein